MPYMLEMHFRARESVYNQIVVVAKSWNIVNVTVTIFE